MVNVHKSDLDYIHDIAKELWLKLEKKELFDESEDALKIKHKIESGDFYIEEERD